MIKPWDCVLYQLNHLNSTRSRTISYARRYTICSRADNDMPNLVTFTGMSDREKRKNAYQRNGRRYQ